MVLTSAGRKLLPEAEKVVAAAQALRSRARAIKGEVTGRVRVGTVSDPEFVRVGDFLAQARRAEYPLLEIEIHHEVTGVALAKVHDGTLDASVLLRPRHAIRCGRRCRCSISAGASSCRPRGAIASSSFHGTRSSRCRGSSRRPVSTLRMLVDDLFRTRGSSPVTRVEADNEAVIRSLVVAGAGVALMREDLAREAVAAGEAVLWSNVRPETTLHFLYLRQREHDPEIRALLDVLHHVWTSAPASLRASL